MSVVADCPRAFAMIVLVVAVVRMIVALGAVVVRLEVVALKRQSE